MDLAATGSETLEMLRAGYYPLMLLDLHLPDMNGLEILRTVQTEKIPTAVVVITSQGSLNIAIEAMKAGAYDFILKPVAHEGLITTLQNASEKVSLEAGLVEAKCPAPSLWATSM